MNDKTCAVIEKIKKLLALANSSNEHEAALAAGHAQRLLSEHNLAMSDIDTTDKPDSADKIDVVVPKNLPKWLRYLCSGVSTAFDCQTVHYPTSGKMAFIGVGADVAVASYTFNYLHHVVRKLGRNFLKHHVDDRITGRERTLQQQSYFLGAVSTISLRLREQKIQTPITSTALVPVKDALIKRAMGELGVLRTVKSRRSFINTDAYGRGQADGRQVGINKGIGSANSSKNLTW